MTLKLFALAAAVALVGGSAMASGTATAELSQVSGTVMVNAHGKVAPASAASLKTGDRVIASADGKGQVKFSDGCVVNLAPASMLTISAKSPCAQGAGLVKAQSSQALEGLSTAGWVAVGIFVGTSAYFIGQGPSSP